MTEEKKPGKILRNMFSDLFPLEDFDEQRTTENVCKILNHYYGETKYTDSDGMWTAIYDNGEECWIFNWVDNNSSSTLEQLGKQLIEFINKELFLFKLELLQN